MQIVLSGNELMEIMTEKFGRDANIVLVVTETEERLSRKYKYGRLPNGEQQPNILLELPSTLTFDINVAPQVRLIATMFDPSKEPRIEGPDSAPAEETPSEETPS